MTRIEHGQIQELIAQSNTLAGLVLDTERREEAGPVNLPAILQAVVRSREDADSMTERLVPVINRHLRLS